MRFAYSGGHTRATHECLLKQWNSLKQKPPGRFEATEGLGFCRRFYLEFEAQLAAEGLGVVVVPAEVLLVMHGEVQGFLPLDP